jgi:2-iminobutanoate/2-iminopropanoate deaminase
MAKKVVLTDKAPNPVGPYSQGIITGNLVFTAGQGGVVPGTKAPVAGLEAQTRQVMENIKAIVEAAGSSMDKIVKMNVYLADINDFAAMNAIYATYFGAEPPARTTIQAAALPMGLLVEIEAIAEL